MRRPPVVIITVIALAVTGFGAATVIGASDQPEPLIVPGGAGSDAIEHVVPDPRGKGRAWGVTSFEDKNGKTCAAVGRVVDKQVGAVHPDGSFTAYPIADGGSCMDLSIAPAGAQVTKGPDATTVHGVTGPKVRSIMAIVNGAGRELPLGARGTFLAVYRPDVAIDAVKVTATLQDGSVVTLIG